MNISGHPNSDIATENNFATFYSSLYYPRDARI